MRRVYLHVGIRSRIELRGLGAGLFVVSVGQYWIKQAGKECFWCEARMVWLTICAKWPIIGVQWAETLFA
jgi:hypothetical protein